MVNELSPLDEQYFVWLYGQVAEVEKSNPKMTYWNLLKQLYTTEFLYIVANDENRAEDGIALRGEFVRSERLRGVDPLWMTLNCSMLEMLIALARRLYHEDDGEPRVWFWLLLENLEIARFNDQVWVPRAVDLIDDVLQGVVFRLYNKNGRGGLFPLKHAEENQRFVELWYQMSAYIQQ